MVFLLRSSSIEHYLLKLYNHCTVSLFYIVQLLPFFFLCLFSGIGRHLVNAVIEVNVFYRHIIQEGLP